MDSKPDYQSNNKLDSMKLVNRPDIRNVGSVFIQEIWRKECTTESNKQNKRRRFRRR